MKGAGIGAITEAIRSASPGDHIRLQAGVYEEAIIVDRLITIFADQPGGTIIRPPGGAPGLRITADATIAGLSFEGGGGKDAAIEIAAGSPTLSSLSVDDAGTGIIIRGEQTSASLDNCRFNGCRIGIQVTEQARVNFTDCRVENTVAYPLLVSKHSFVKALRTVFLKSISACVVVMENSRAEFHACEWFDSPVIAENQRVFHSQLAVLKTSEVVLTGGCRIANGSAVGILVSGGVLTMTGGVVEKNGWAGVQVSSGGRAEISDSTLIENLGAGLFGTEGATVEGLELKVLRNAKSGVAVIGASNVMLHRSLSQGNLCGLFAAGASYARLEDCNLSGNRQGPFNISEDCRRDFIRVLTEGASQ